MKRRHGSVSAALAVAALLWGCGGPSDQERFWQSLEGEQSVTSVNDASEAASMMTALIKRRDPMTADTHEKRVEQFEGEIRRELAGYPPQQRISYLLGVLVAPDPMENNLKFHERWTIAREASRRILAGMSPPPVRECIRFMEQYGARAQDAEDLVVLYGDSALPAVREELENGYAGARGKAERGRRIQLRCSLAVILQKLPGRTGTEELLDLFRNDPEHEVRFTSLHALWKKETWNWVYNIGWFLTSPDPHRREFARVVLTEIYGRKMGSQPYRWFSIFEEQFPPPNSPLEKLAECLEIRQGPVAAYAREALQRVAGEDLGPDPDAWRKHFRDRRLALAKELLPGLKDRSPIVRGETRTVLIDLTGQVYGPDPSQWERFFREYASSK